MSKTRAPIHIQQSIPRKKVILLARTKINTFLPGRRARAKAPARPVGRDRQWASRPAGYLRLQNARDAMLAIMSMYQKNGFKIQSALTSSLGVSSLHAQQTNDVEGPYVRRRSLPSCPLRKADTLCLPVVWARRRPRPGCRA